MNSEAVLKLDESALGYVGKSVGVGPIFGWGWSGIQPEPFRLTIAELMRDATGSIRGGLGQINTPRHRFDQHWVAFTLRYRGSWDFEANLGTFNVCLYSERPESCPSFVVDGSFVHSTQGTVTAGCARIGNDA
jgi:hypothetical protein